MRLYLLLHIIVGLPGVVQKLETRRWTYLAAENLCYSAGNLENCCTTFGHTTTQILFGSFLANTSIGCIYIPALYMYAWQFMHTIEPLIDRYKLNCALSCVQCENAARTTCVLCKRIRTYICTSRHFVRMVSMLYRNKTPSTWHGSLNMHRAMFTINLMSVSVRVLR